MWFEADPDVVPGVLMVGVEPADIDLPGECGFMLALSGWFAHLGRPPSALRILHGGSVLSLTRTGLERPDVDAYLSKLWPAPPHAKHTAVGFQAYISKLILPPDAICDLVCEFEDGQQPALIRVGRIGGFAPTPAVPQGGDFAPILITALGRSGTTFMAGLLGLHPEILAAGGYPFEYRLASYYWHTAYITSAPADFNFSLHPDAFEQRWPHMTGYNPYNSRILSLDTHVSKLRGWLNTERVIDNINHARKGIDDFYKQISAYAGKRKARFFVEKMTVSPLIDVASNLHLRAREIIIVRDFRDVFLSARAFNAARGSQSFGRDRHDTEIEWLAGCAHAASLLVERYLSRRTRCLLVRYEDLLLNQDWELRRIFEYIGVASDPSVLQAVRDGVLDTEGVAHRTSGSAEESIGRWRRELRAEEQERVTNLFRTSLEQCGYPLL